jgi:hypothetical protein
MAATAGAKDNPKKQEELKKEEKPAGLSAPEVRIAKGCCCCVEDLQFKYKGGAVIPAPKKAVVVGPDTDPKVIDMEGQPQFGNEFKIFITYRNKRITDAGEQPADCVLKWMEMTDRPPGTYIKSGVKPNEWTNIGEVVGKNYPGLFKDGTLGPWAKRPTVAKVCPYPQIGLKKAPPVELTDKPSAFYGRSRTLYFHIVVESAPNCTCKQKNMDLYAKQVLDDGPSNKNTKFYKPGEPGSKPP